ncbi:MAG: protein kinase [Planctomycetota bacterium]|nr:protein kinase [Planctomycetota bacterium]
MAKLILHLSDSSKEFPLNGSVTIGRQSSNTIQINEPKASRSHARVVQVDGEYLVEDLESSNGTKVNGRKVAKLALSHGDTIQIGATRLVFDDPGAKAAKPKVSSSKSTREIKAHAQKEDTDALCGKDLGGYQIISRLGQGGMGTVYRAKQLSMDREVALKVMKKDLSQNREFVKGFLKEARMAGQLTHPAIVQVHDVGEDGGTLYFSMEIVEGESVYAMLKRDGKVNVAKSLDIAVAVCEALAHAQRHRVVHQDIKPHNIMVDKRGIVKVADLGLATMAGRDKNAEKKSNVLMGTPHYMAPEQSQKRAIDTRTDLYALGATLFHMVTGRVPFDGPTSLVVITKHITQERPDPRQYDVTIPADLAGVILEMMSVDIEKRPGDPKALAERLKGIKDAYLKELEDSARNKGKSKGVIKRRATLNDMAAVKPTVVRAEEVVREERRADADRERRREEAVATPSNEWAKLGLGAAVVVLGLVLVVMMFGSIKNAILGPAGPEPKKPVKSAKTEDPETPPDTTPSPFDPATKTSAKTQTPEETKTTAQPQTPDVEGQALAEWSKALEARDRALQSGNFAGARQALLRFRDAHRVGSVSDAANKELRETDRIISDTLGQMYADAEKAANAKDYRVAAAKSTRLISADAQGSFGKKASDLMQRIDTEAEAPYKQFLAQADKHVATGRLDEAMKSMGSALDGLAGTRWGDPLGARQLQLVFANKLLKAMERARKQRADEGKPTEVAVSDTAGKKVMGILREINGLILSAEIGGAGFKHPLAKMQPDDIYHLIEALGQGEDHLGMANLMLILKHDDLAKKEIDRAMKIPDQSAEAARLAAKLSGESNLHVYDFSKWQHQSDWDAPSGAWSTKDDQYVLESPEGGDTALKTDAIGGPFAAKGGRIAFEFNVNAAKAGDGWYVAMEFGTEQRNVTALFSAEGYRVQANAGEMAQVKGDWKPSGATNVELEFKDNTVTIVLNGKRGEPLTATGVSDLKGTIAFHIRETTCALDNITLRNVE